MERAATAPMIPTFDFPCNEQFEVHHKTFSYMELVSTRLHFASAAHLKASPVLVKLLETQELQNSHD